MSREKKRDPAAFPSIALRRAHVIMIVAATIFAFGFAAYLLFVKRGRVGQGESTLSVDTFAFFCVAGGVALIVYLRRFLASTRMDAEDEGASEESAS